MPKIRFFALSVAIVTIAVAAQAQAPAQNAPPLPRDQLSKILIVDLTPRGQLQTLAALERQPMSDNDIIVPWLKANADRIEPLLLMELARRVFAQSHGDGLEWFAIGYARTVYDAKRCADPTADDGLAIALLTRLAGTQIPAYLASHHDEYAAAEQRALARRDLFTDAVSPLWICIHGLEAYRSTMTGKPAELALRPRSVWPTIQQSIRQAMTAGIRKTQAAQAARQALPAGTIELRPPNQGIPFALAWSPDGKRLAMTLKRTFRIAIWDVASHMLLREIGGRRGLEPALAYAPDGHDIVTSIMQDGPHGRSHLAVSVIDGESRAVRQIFGTLRPNPSVAIDYKRHVIAYVTELPMQAVALADLDHPANATATLSTARSAPSALAFGPDGVLAVGTLGAKILLFSAGKPTLIGTINATIGDQILALAFSPDGRYLAAGGWGAHIVGHRQDGHPVIEPGDPLHIWRVADGALVLSCKETSANPLGTIRSVAWSADSRQLAYAASGGKIHLQDVNPPQHARVLMQFGRRSDQFSDASLAFSPDGTKLAMTGDDIAMIVPFTERDSAQDQGATCQ
jgi:WD domain, G-beta repeat/WD40-like Beta Propeller Repeat